MTLLDIWSLIEYVKVDMCAVLEVFLQCLVHVPYLTGPHFWNLFGSGSRSRGSRGDE